MVNLGELNPLQRVTLRFAVTGLLFYGLAILEGMMMHSVQANVLPLDAEHFFAVMNAHPIVGIFGYSFMLVMGAFYFLVPTVLKKRLHSQRLAEANWKVLAVGVTTVWVSSFAFRYAALYTNYWPLPVSLGKPLGLAVYSVGMITVMVGVLIFCYNLFATVFRNRRNDKPLSALVISSFGLDGFINLYDRMRGRPERIPSPEVPLPVVAIFRGTIDTVLDALVLGGVCLLFLVYAAYQSQGLALPTGWFNALIYKNIYWWGLDLIADGLVLIYVAGSWYLLTMVITGRQIYMHNFARAALFVELVVSWFVWSHHLLSDQLQPVWMRIFSGEIITAFELVTSGIAVFCTLATLWQARPLKLTIPILFLLGGILGFGLGVPAGILQADLGMNRLLHNTQWVIGAHAHMQILVGLSCTLFAALYAIFPMVTKKEVKSAFLSKVHFGCQVVGGIGMSVSMGFAGLNGMLRRTLYAGDATFLKETLFAVFFGTILSAGYLAMMYNLVSSIGIPSLISLFVKSPRYSPTPPRRLEDRPVATLSSSL